MSLVPLREALDALYAALAEPDIGPDDIVITLDRAAGHRFEAWFLTHVDPRVDLDPVRYQYIPDTDGHFRYVRVNGVRFLWPVEAVKLPGGEIALRALASPVPEAAET